MPTATRSRTPRRRLLVAFNSLLAVALVAALGVGVYLKWSLNQVDRVDLGEQLESSSGSVQNILLVGSDNRANLSPADQRKYGKASSTPGLADTIMLVRLDSKDKKASVMSIPRDTLVTIYSPEGKALRQDKINSAYSAGGLKGQKSLTRTVSTNFNVPINHFVQVDFDGFRGIVEAVGGVKVPFDTPVRDRMSGLNIAKAGCVRLKGDDALAYVRSRSPEVYKNGRWVSDAGIPDLERIERQQGFVRRVMGMAVGEAKSNPLALKGLLDAGVRNVQLDSGFSTAEAARTARTFSATEPESVDMFTLPTISGGPAQRIDQKKLGPTIDRFLGETQAAAAQAQPPASQSGRSTPSTSPRVANNPPSTGSIATQAGADCA